MRIIYYVEDIAVTNFILDVLLLRFVGALTGTKARWFRYLLGGGVGAAAVLLIYASGANKNWIVLLLLRFLTALCVVAVTFGAKGLELLYRTAVFYGTAILLGGIAGFLEQHSLFQSFPAGLLIPAALLLPATAVLAKSTKYRRRAAEGVYPVCLTNKGHSVRLKALYDSGNHLYEPISGKPVILVRRARLQELELCESDYRAVPYTSVGKINGMLNAYRLDEITVNNGMQLYSYNGWYAAAPEEDIWEKCSYEGILHRDISTKTI